MLATTVRNKSMWTNLLACLKVHEHNVTEPNSSISPECLWWNHPNCLLLLLLLHLFWSCVHCSLNYPFLPVAMLHWLLSPNVAGSGSCHLWRKTGAQVLRPYYYVFYKCYDWTQVFFSLSTCHWLLLVCYQQILKKFTFIVTCIRHPTLLKSIPHVHLSYPNTPGLQPPRSTTSKIEGPINYVQLCCWLIHWKDSWLSPFQMMVLWEITTTPLNEYHILFFWCSFWHGVFNGKLFIHPPVTGYCWLAINKHWKNPPLSWDLNQAPHSSGARVQTTRLTNTHGSEELGTKTKSVIHWTSFAARTCLTYSSDSPLS